ncbi:hypothetical protein V1523DRAFT_421679 [Lipomyces doorenjongii]
MRTHSVFHGWLLKEFVESDLPRHPVPSPPRMEIDCELYDEVDEMINSRWTRKGVEYLVAWLGYDETTWEPLAHLTRYAALVREFRCGIHGNRDWSTCTPTFRRVLEGNVRTNP